MKSWQLGRPGSLPYRCYDFLRGRLNRDLVRFLADRAIHHPGSRILEAGSGPALASSMFAREPNVGLSVALDIDIEALRLARARDPSIAVVVADLAAMPFRAEVFDLVWNSSTLEHLDDDRTALAEMRRVARRGGYAFVGVPFSRGPLGVRRFLGQSRGAVWIGEVFSEAELSRRLRLSGLEPSDGLKYFFWFFVGALGRRS